MNITKYAACCFVDLVGPCYQSPTSALRDCGSSRLTHLARQFNTSKLRTTDHGSSRFKKGLSVARYSEVAPKYILGLILFFKPV